MHVFITGASGWVGSRVAQLLLSKGHTVTGLARSSTSADKLKAAGLTPLLGSVADTSILEQGARQADAVIHCAFDHDFSKFGETLQTEAKAIRAMGDALAGTGKAFITTSGLGGVKPPGDMTIVDETNAGILDDHASRIALERIVVEYADKGVRAMVARLPPSVHGKNDWGFAVFLVQLARDNKESAYLGDGSLRWSATHVDDVARFYIAMLENGKAGQRYHAVADQGVVFKEFATVVGEGLGVPVVSKSQEEAEGHFKWLARFMTWDMAATAEWTKKELDWEPKEIGWLDDIKANYL